MKLVYEYLARMPAEDFLEAYDVVRGSTRLDGVGNAMGALACREEREHPDVKGEDTDERPQARET